MESINFGKGLAIGLLVSLCMWVVIYCAVSALTHSNDNLEKPKIESTASNTPL